MDFYTWMSLMINLLTVKILIDKRRRLREKKRRRLYWVHPLISQRLSKGHFHTVYLELRKYPKKFHEYARMSVTTFDELLEVVRPQLTRASTNMRASISPEERLLVTLRYLATGDTFASLHFHFLLGKMTICKIVHETCAAIWSLLRNQVMLEPTEEKWRAISEGFKSTCHFPNCVGALDGKRIRIKMPPKNVSESSRYKNYFSIVLMAIVDSAHNFVAVDVGAYRTVGDSKIFRTSPMGRKILEGKFNIPSPRPIEEGGDPLPFVFVADEAFSLSNNIMKPYPKRGLDFNGKIFNYRLSRARRQVECAFGILANKWRIFQSTIQLKPSHVDMIVKSACSLHNFVLQRERYANDLLDHNMEDLEWPSVRYPDHAANIREKFAQYFMSPAGELPWQYSKV
ncbi:protein SLX4IP isoform X1 [Rana temporaria]|uniref:protein SLX4IP isoform X1 n=1 Tax=Rana temporaria TaxID=8407 RepID=UPI001AAC4973|nr:protein SLX4IP isoform X1 [Rana temporaria]XP_040207241.1 protein SLX4IP isoform X1 [Rana temporaria]